MLASLFHEYGFQVVPLEEAFFMSMLQGPVITRGQLAISSAVFTLCYT